MKYLLTALLLTASVFAQTDWEKWNKKENPYLIEKNSASRDYSLAGKNAVDAAAKIVIMGYWFFISDLDGDNCPFAPTCSAFLLQSVKETNILKGTLMFGDRFLRDANVFNRDAHYYVVKNNRHYDPVANYMLDKEKVKSFFDKYPDYSK